MKGFSRIANRGFTLVELLVSLLILTIIVSLAPPSYTQLMDRFASDTSTHSLKKMLTRTRILALEMRQALTLCPMTGKDCSSDWSQPLTIFSDDNRNQKLDDEEQHIRTLEEHTSRGYWLKSRAAQNFIRFNEQGHAFSSASTFIFCLDSGRQEYARQVVISFQGRLRSASYLNSQGNPYSHFKKLRCN